MCQLGYEINTEKWDQIVPNISTPDNITHDVYRSMLYNK